MCIIAVCEKRALTDKELENCFSTNKDGAGIAWHKDGMNHYIKGLMKLDEVKDVYSDIRECGIIPHVVHFRTSTTGGVNEELTHPFIVSKDSPVADMVWDGKDPLLFHNGCFRNWEESMLNFYIRKSARIPDGNWSDSRFMAILVHFLGKNVLKIKGSKYALLMPSGRIWTYGNFIHDDGVHFSTTAYKARSYGYSYGDYYEYGLEGNMRGNAWLYREEDDYQGLWGGGKHGRKANSKNKVDSAKEDSAKNNGQGSKHPLLDGAGGQHQGGSNL